MCQEVDLGEPESVVGVACVEKAKEKLVEKGGEGQDGPVMPRTFPPQNFAES